MQAWKSVKVSAFLCPSKLCVPRSPPCGAWGQSWDDSLSFWGKRQTLAFPKMEMVLSSAEEAQCSASCFRHGKLSDTNSSLTAQPARSPCPFSIFLSLFSVHSPLHPAGISPPTEGNKELTHQPTPYPRVEQLLQEVSVLLYRVK